MMNCREISRLVSESLDHDLSFRQRMGLWFHLSMCRLCFGFRRNMLWIRDAAHDSAEEIESDDVDTADMTLPTDARIRMKRALRDETP